MAGDCTVTAVWTHVSPPKFLQSRTLPPGGTWTDPVEVTSFFTDAYPSPAQLAVYSARTATAIWINAASPAPAPVLPE